jgi:hypothetical protein
MAKEIESEKWRKVKFDVAHVNELRFEVSNLGRVKSFSKISQGNLLKGSMTNGYKIIRFKLFSERETVVQKRLEDLMKQSSTLQKKITLLRDQKGKKLEVKTLTKTLLETKLSISDLSKNDLKKRTMHKHVLVHRLVAQYFLPKPKKNEILVGHLDFKKTNNEASNLKWMSVAENSEHIQHSPHVKKARKLQKNAERNLKSKVIKLNPIKVAKMKKMLNEGKTIQSLVLKFDVSHTQILRIKRGINWGDIEAEK